MVQPKDKKAGIHRNINRATAVLSALASAPNGLRMVEVIRATELSNASAHRILGGLVANGLAEYEADGAKYFLGIKIMSWASAARNRHGLVERAAPALKRLALATEDTVYLTMRVDNEAVCVDRCVGKFPIKTLSLNIGDRRPLGIGAGSLALIAFLPDSRERDRILADQALTYSDFGIDEKSLREMIKESQKLGYALNDGKILPGMSAVAVPIFSKRGVPVAAISVAAILGRMENPRREEIVADLRQETQRLQNELSSSLDYPE